jgi:hypothetical protein
VLWIVVGEAITSALCFYVNTFYTRGIVGLSSFDQLRLIGRITAMAGVVGASAYLGTLASTVPIWQLAVGTLSGGAAGALWIACFERPSVALVMGAMQRVGWTPIGSGRHDR